MSEQGNLDRTMENKLIFPKALVQKKVLPWQIKLYRQKFE